MALLTKQLLAWMGLLKQPGNNTFAEGDCLMVVDGKFRAANPHKYVLLSGSATVNVTQNPVISVQCAAGASVTVTIDGTGTPNSIVTLKRTTITDTGTISIFASPNRPVQHPNGTFAQPTLVLPTNVVAISWILSDTGTWELHDVSYSQAVSLSSQTGTSYTLTNANLGQIVVLTNAAAITVTLAPDLIDGFNCVLEQGGAGAISWANGTGVTSTVYPSGATKSAGVGARIAVDRRGGNAYRINGQITS